jgi:hypothetical protein
MTIGENGEKHVQPTDWPTGDDWALCALCKLAEYESTNLEPEDIIPLIEEVRILRETINLIYASTKRGG